MTRVALVPDAVSSYQGILYSFACFPRNSGVLNAGKCRCFTQVSRSGDHRYEFTPTRLVLSLIPTLSVVHGLFQHVPKGGEPEYYEDG